MGAEVKQIAIRSGRGVVGRFAGLASATVFRLSSLPVVSNSSKQTNTWCDPRYPSTTRSFPSLSSSIGTLSSPARERMEGSSELLYVRFQAAAAAPDNLFLVATPQLWRHGSTWPATGRWALRRTLPAGGPTHGGHPVERSAQERRGSPAREWRTGL